MIDKVLSLKFDNSVSFIDSKVCNMTLFQVCA